MVRSTVVCLSVRTTNVGDFFARTECVTSKNPFDFGADPEHNADTGIFLKEFYTAVYGYTGDAESSS